MLREASIERLDAVVQRTMERLVPPDTEVSFEVTEDGIRNVGIGSAGESMQDRPRALLADAIRGWAASAHTAFGASFLVSARHVIQPGSAYSAHLSLPDLAFLHVAMMKRGDPRANAVQSTLTIRPSTTRSVTANEAINQFFTGIMTEHASWFEAIVLIQIFTGTRQGRWSGEDQALLTRLYPTVISSWPGPPRKHR